MERVYTVYHSSRGMWKQKVVTTVWAETGFETGSETVQKRTIHPFFRRFPATGLNRFRGWSCPIKFIEEKETKKLKIFLPSLVLKSWEFKLLFIIKLYSFCNAHAIHIRFFVVALFAMIDDSI